MNKLNRFTKTIAGKTVVFITCIVSLYILILSVIGSVFMISTDFYTKSEEKIFADYVYDDMRNDGYQIVWNTVAGNHMDYSDTNLVFKLTDENGTVISASESFDTAVGNEYEYHYGLLTDDESVTDIFYRYDLAARDENAAYYTISFKLKDGLPETDGYAFMHGMVHLLYSLRFGIYFLGLFALAAVIACFITLMCVSARRADTDEIVPGPFNRVPFDVMTVIMLAIGTFFFYFLDSIGYGSDTAVILGIVLVFALYANFILGFCMSVAARIKQKSLFKNTLVFYTFRIIGKTIKGTVSLIGKIPLIWRTAVSLGVLTVIEFTVIILTWWESDNLLLWWIAEKMVLSAVILYVALCMRKLAKAGDALANGDPDYRTDTKYMFWDFRRHAENLNSIADGIGIAVDKQLKSERMKTELITNVSHDIKTPLTSIINYAALIGKEECDNENITEYSAVLVRQSERLKRLIEDLVEASKASSGSLDVELAKCDAAVFITQAAGEYTEKTESAGLTLITKQPETPVYIMADGRRMWRIFDNLMNNICKYALSGTRVYLALENTGGNAVITFKNISGASLDVSEDELMERFVRGDSSRSTEGNGLGLAIAKSLAELQGGTLKIETDGDLFKATLTFPCL